jgi:hypothetical protein
VRTFTVEVDKEVDRRNLYAVVQPECAFLCAIAVTAVSFRQNGVGPEKNCADAILPKGHPPIQYRER